MEISYNKKLCLKNFKEKFSNNEENREINMFLMLCFSKSEEEENLEDSCEEYSEFSPDCYDFEE